MWKNSRKQDDLLELLGYPEPEAYKLLVDRFCDKYDPGWDTRYLPPPTKLENCIIILLIPAVWLLWTPIELTYSLVTGRGWLRKRKLKKKNEAILYR